MNPQVRAAVEAARAMAMAGAVLGFELTREANAAALGDHPDGWWRAYDAACWAFVAGVSKAGEVLRKGLEATGRSPRAVDEVLDEVRRLAKDAQTLRDEALAPALPEPPYVDPFQVP